MILCKLQSTHIFAANNCMTKQMKINMQFLLSTKPRAAAMHSTRSSPKADPSTRVSPFCCLVVVRGILVCFGLRGCFSYSRTPNRTSQEPQPPPQPTTYDVHWQAGHQSFMLRRSRIVFGF